MLVGKIIITVLVVIEKNKNLVRVRSIHKNNCLSFNLDYMQNGSVLEGINGKINSRQEFKFLVSRKELINIELFNKNRTKELHPEREILSYIWIQAI